MISSLPIPLLEVPLVGVAVESSTHTPSSSDVPGPHLSSKTHAPSLSIVPGPHCVRGVSALQGFLQLVFLLYRGFFNWCFCSTGVSSTGVSALQAAVSLLVFLHYQNLSCSCNRIIKNRTNNFYFFRACR